MEFGQTAGRGFESPAAPYIVGGLLLLAAVLWIWFHFDIRRNDGDRDDGNKD